MGFCRYSAEFSTEVKIYVGIAKHITVDVGVCFHKPISLDHRILPSPCLPTLPSKVGKLSLFLDGVEGRDARYLGFLGDVTSRTDYWRYIFMIERWQKARADYVLLPSYADRLSQDNCAYYVGGFCEV